MYRIHRLLALLVLLLLLAGCLAGDDTEPTATPASVATRPDPTATTLVATTAPSATEEPGPNATTTPTDEARPTATQPDTTPTVAAISAPEGIAYELIETIGQPLTPQAPMDVQMLDDGSIAVADAGRREIQIYNPSLELMSSWPTVAESPSSNPGGALPAEQIAASQGSFYAGMSSINGIVHYSANGELVGQYSFEDTSLTLFDLVAGPDGQLYAAVGSFRSNSPAGEQPFGIYVFDAGLELVETWESGPAWMPLSLAFDAEGTLHSLVIRGNAGASGGDLAQPARFVAIDPAVYDPAVWETPLDFEIEGTFDGLAVTGNGDYLLVDEDGGDAATTVYIMSRQGDELDRWEVAGHAAVLPRTAAGLLVTTPPALPDGPERIILADPLGQRVWILGLAGDVIREFAGDPAYLAVPSSIVILPSGDPAVLDIASREISIFEADSSRPNRYPIDVELRHPLLGVSGQMFAGPDNDLWYISPNEASPFSLRRVDLTTGEISPFETDTVIDAGDMAIFSPTTGATGPDGRLYLANADGTVRSFEPDGSYVERWPADGTSPVEAVLDVLAGPDGIYILWRGATDAGSGTFVSRFSDAPADSLAFIGAATGDAPVTGTPRSLAVGTDGRLYLLDPRTGDIAIFDTAGELISRWNAATADFQLADIAVDPAGRIYLTDTLQREVLVYAEVEWSSLLIHLQYRQYRNETIAEMLSLRGLITHTRY